LASRVSGHRHPPVPMAIWDHRPITALPERFPLAGGPTALQPLPRLGHAMGFANDALWAKRDDLTALAGGGNKARKLEFLVAEAKALGCEVLVTGGAPQ